jgi:hypothetical protein
MSKHCRRPRPGPCAGDLDPGTEYRVPDTRAGGVIASRHTAVNTAAMRPRDVVPRRLWDGVLAANAEEPRLIGYARARLLSGDIRPALLGPLWGNASGVGDHRPGDVATCWVRSWIASTGRATRRCRSHSALQCSSTCAGARAYSVSGQSDRKVELGPAPVSMIVNVLDVSRLRSRGFGRVVGVLGCPDVVCVCRVSDGGCGRRRGSRRRMRVRGPVGRARPRPGDATGGRSR